MIFRRQEIVKDNSGIERRFFQSDVRAAEAPESRMIQGYGAVFNKYTQIYWDLEIIDPGAFANADFSECACLHNHEDHLVLGRVRNNTLTLSTDTTGLLYKCDVIDTNTGNDVLKLIKRGDIYQSSFAFTVKKVQWEEVDRESLVGIVSDEVLNKVSYGGKVGIRRIMEVGKLYDVSPVTYPAYEDATVAMSERKEFFGDGNGDERNLRTRLDMDLRLMEMQMQA